MRVDFKETIMSASPSQADFQNLLYSSSELDLYLDLNNTGIKPEVLTAHTEMFDRAFRSMQELEAGGIANPDEDRQVGHYWLRAPELSPNSEIREQIERTQASILQFSRDILKGHIQTPHGENFSDLLLIGIGGSALGPQFIADALAEEHGLRPHFMDNTDSDGIDLVLNGLGGRLARTLVLVISKSGGTAETRNGMLEAQEAFTRAKLDFSAQAVAITGEGSQLYDTASSENWLAIFPMWDWVGGRTSVMSAVGLLPAGLMGIDIQAFLTGAKKMDELTRYHGLMQNPAALLAVSWYILGAGKGKKDMVILPYRDRLLLFSRYLQQLIMESLGKALDLDGQRVDQGIAVYGNKGSTDQHAYVQQLRDGLDNFFVTFIEVLRERSGDSILVDGKNTSGEYLQGFFMGTETALSQNDRNSLVITVGDLTPESIGALIALYERTVGFYADFIHINAYHQPGVEAGKKAAGAVLDLKNQILELLAKSDTSLSINEIAEVLEMKGQKRQIYLILRHLAANQPLRVEGSFHEPETVRVGIH